MSSASVIALALLLFEDDHFSPTLVLKYGGGHFGAVDKGRTHFEFLTFPEGEHFVDFDFRAGVGLRITIEDENIALGYRVLLALGLDCRFHRK